MNFLISLYCKLQFKFLLLESIKSIYRMIGAFCMTFLEEQKWDY
uniref:Uncharacterized protein n=1 Tax=Siphoviridae sp. ctgmM3 TaxID=2827912 RepID=A0A8S5TK13_9CAUD|nr:MAG TPA: hypothetical protein [Siphoviridae sp. ctgmM3]